MGIAKRVDKNQPEIVKKFRESEVSLSHTHQIGKGFPDICVGLEGISIIAKPETLKLVREIIVREFTESNLSHTIDLYEGVNLLIEIKDGEQPPSKKKLTEAEEKWHNEWKGQKVIVESEEDVDDLLSSLK